jgi:eukaryotic-like serine/threonine-protein kinase
MPSETPETIGPYRVLDLLGKAGQSAVYKAVDPRGRPVAVKLFPARLAEDPATVERFHRELGAVTPVSRHPHMVQILETGQEGDRLYLAMELVEGTSLDRVLKQNRLSLSQAFAVMRDICQGLAHAHQHGIVHGALTPRNVLVSPDFGTVKVADFAATRYETTAANLTATLSTGEIRLGALYYLAPEILEGRASLDARSDVYSAGVIFHEMLTGRPPGPKLSLPTQIVPSLSSEVDVVVLRCIARRPEERYGSVADLLTALERLEEKLRLRVFTEIRDISQQNRAPLYVGLTLLVLILAALGYWFLR